MRALSLALTATLFITPATARNAGHDPSSYRYYRSADGYRVHGPTQHASAAYGRISAVCRDGTFSYSHHHSGTCSGHHGVSEWR